MSQCQEAITKFREADHAYQDALAAAEQRKRERDQAILELLDGRTIRQVAELTGLSHPRVAQIATRARRSST